MISITKILSAAHISYVPYAAPMGSGSVFMTTAGQLVGSYNDLKTLQNKIAAYHWWEAHHIVEFQDLVRLGAAHLFPAREEQLCVLLPESGHRKRINAMLKVEPARPRRTQWRYFTRRL